MTKSSKRLALYLAHLLPFTIAAVTLRTIALLLDLDKGLLYFNSQTLITASVAVITAFCVFAVSYSFIPGQKMSPASSFVNPRTYIPSGLAAIAMLFVGCDLVSQIIKGLSAQGSKEESLTPIILALTTVLAFASTANFFLNVFFEKRQSRSRAAFCICTVLFFAFYAGYLFFSKSLPINSPNKATDQMAFISLSVFFLYETRISLGRPAWRPYVTFGMIAASLSLYSSVPSLIFYLANGASDAAIISQGIAENVLTLVLGIYIISRLSLVLTLVPDEICEAALAIEKMAKIRSEEIAEAQKERELSEAREESEIQKTAPDEGANYEMDFTALTDFPDIAKKTDNEKEI